MAVLAFALTPLFGILGALVGLGVGFLFVTLFKQSPADRRERDLAIARDTARRTFNETLASLFERLDEK